MNQSKKTIFILGCGAIGFPLAACLTNAGRKVVAVRTGRNDVSQSTVTVTVNSGEQKIQTRVDTISLSKLSVPEGIFVLTAKSYANNIMANKLKEKSATGPVVILQNGIGVEQPFLDRQFLSVYRCVLFFTSQVVSEYTFNVRPVAVSPLGLIAGNKKELENCVVELTTKGFPFRKEENIQKEIWKKAIINCVFNSICPLLDTDNGIFIREKKAADLAREIIRECVTVTKRLSIGLNETEIMDQLLRISKASDGQLISTLQDIRSGRQTEIEFLNMEIAHIAASLQPKLHLPKTELLGKMIITKSLLQK